MAAPQDGIFKTLQSRYDAISVYEGMNYLFKKSIGYPNYFPQGPLYAEIVENYNSFPFINKISLFIILNNRFTIIKSYVIFK